MPARWSADSVLALAPDDSSRRAAATLGRPAPWDGTGAAGDLVWGLCAGSAKNPYQVIVELDGPAFKCSCPSRKFPCKHALGLLLLWSAGTVPDLREPSDYARAWHESRREKAERASAAADAAGAGQKDTAAAARRAAERAQRAASGLDDLQEWLRDQVRVGLAAAATAPAASQAAATVAGPADMAARMVDAQAPGVAGTLRGLSGLARSAALGLPVRAAGGAGVRGAGTDQAGPAAADGAAGWPARLLAEYAMLHLLTRAHERLDALPDGLAAVVRSRVGYPVSRDDVLARPAVTGRWLVTAVRELTDGTVPGRRIWLRDDGTGQWAMLLTYAAPGGAWQDPRTARLRPGTEVHADLHYYPGQPPLRAVPGSRHGEPVAAKPPAAPDGLDGMLAGWADGVARDPWLTYWPALLTGTPLPPGRLAEAGAGPAGCGADPRRWYLADQEGNALPLADRESLWTLLAVSGGQPVTVAGEWHPDGLAVLTAWHGDEAVTL